MSDKTEDIQIIQAEPMRHFCIVACKEVQLSQEHSELLADTHYFLRYVRKAG